MNNAVQKYLLDANAFIQAKRRFYAFDFCPGYWKILISHCKTGTLSSIDKVADELERGGDDLWEWAEKQLGATAFCDTSNPSVTSAFGEMLEWVMAQTQFTDAAKMEYQGVADGWLAAYAKANDRVVVTLEEFDPKCRKRVPLPNVCRAFDIEWINPFEMLRRLDVKLDWKAQ